MAKVHKAVSLEVPDKEPGEEPATEKQIAYLKRLADSVQLPADLGKWQASALIDQLKRAKGEFQRDVDEGGKGIGCLVIVVGGVLLIVALIARGAFA
jgi:hypothetical protein